MTARERVIAAIEHRQPDRVPRYEAFWEDTVAKYIADELKLPPQRQVMVDGQVKTLGSPIEEYFNFDLQCLYMDVSMRFPSRLVSDDGTMIVVEDQCGYTAQKLLVRELFWSEILQLISVEFPQTNPERILANCFGVTTVRQPISNKPCSSMCSPGYPRGAELRNLSSKNTVFIPRNAA